MAAGEISTFSTRTAIALVAAGVIAFAAFLLLSAFADGMRSGRDGRAHALSTSAVGFKGLADLIGHSGGRAEYSGESWGEDEEALVVFALEAGVSEDELAGLLDDRPSQPNLLILPKWNVMPHASRRGWVRTTGLGGGAEEALGAVGDYALRRGGRAAGTLEGRGILEGFDVPAPAYVQTVAGEGLRPLLVAPGGGVVLAQIGERPLYLLADPDLLNNRALKRPQGAAAALALVEQLNSTGAESVVFDLMLNGFGASRNPLRLAFEPPFLALTLALFAAALLAGLHGAVRFGPALAEERDLAFGKAALIENGAALVRAARREHRAGGAYAALVRDTAARSAPPGLDEEALGRWLDRLTPEGEPPFSALADRLRLAADPHELLAAARALHHWKKERLE